MTILWSFIIRDIYCHHFKDEGTISFLGRTYSELGLKSRTSEYSPELCKYRLNEWLSKWSYFIPVSRQFLTNKTFFWGEGAGKKWKWFLFLRLFQNDLHKMFAQMWALRVHGTKEEVQCGGSNHLRSELLGARGRNGDKALRTETSSSYRGPSIRLSRSRRSVNTGWITEWMAHVAEFFPTFSCYF